MKWIKKGLLFSAIDQVSWAADSALQPTPLVTGPNSIRIYCGMRDKGGISRIGYVDVVKEHDNLKVIGVSKEPVLDVGLPGTFDDNGVVPSAVVKRNDGLYLFYAGYQLVKNVRFLVLGGLARSNDGGVSFQRYQNTPILERTNDEFLFRVLHSIFYDKGRWRAWYGGGNHFETHEGRTLPVYDIRYMESEDGINFPSNGTTVLENGESEHRVGRPYVVKKSEQYYMFFGASTPTIPYRLTYAKSNDGNQWERQADLGLSYSQDDFDSQMSAYPCIVELEGKTYMIYNGNEYGKFGFGYALLEGNL
jgi:hypothetical protein